MPVSVGPQERDHLAEYAEVACFGYAAENAFDRASEQRLVRPFIDHEGRKHLGRIAADEAPLFAKLVEIDASSCETFFQTDAMRFGPDVHATVAGAQAVGEPMRQRIDKEAVILVELNQMRMRIDVRPRGRRRK